MAQETIHVAIYDTWADWEAGFAIAHLASGDWQPEGRRYRIVTVAESRKPITTKAGSRSRRTSRSTHSIPTRAPCS